MNRENEINIDLTEFARNEDSDQSLAEATPVVGTSYESGDCGTCACCSGTCGTSDSCQ